MDFTGYDQLDERLKWKNVRKKKEGTATEN
jgi:hypothetical protein